MNIINLENSCSFDFWSTASYETKYVLTPVGFKYAVHVYASSVKITELSLAGKPGHTCPELRLSPKWEHGGSALTPFLNELGKRSYNVHNLYIDAVQSSSAFDPDNFVSTEWSERQANRIYSPFMELPRLKHEPKKWTLTHAIKALWNGQFRDLKCEGRYTDDYAWDAAVNFDKKQLSDGRSFAKQIIEHPSGWRAWNDGTRIAICCHSFDLNSFVFDIDGQHAGPVESESLAA